MKKQAFFCALLALPLMSLQAENTPPPTQTNSPLPNTPNPKNLLHDQINPTDALAIPLDSSEEELDEEYETLMQIEKEYQKTHPKQDKSAK